MAKFNNPLQILAQLQKIWTNRCTGRKADFSIACYVVARKFHFISELLLMSMDIMYKCMILISCKIYIPQFPAICCKGFNFYSLQISNNILFPNQYNPTNL